MKRLRFTLLELLISLAVFIVIFAILLRFITAGQTAWRGMEKKNDLYASSRVAMNVIEMLLDGVVAGSNYAPFYPYAASTSPENSLAFCTRMPLAVNDNSNRVLPVRLAANSDGVLMIYSLNPNSSVDAELTAVKKFTRVCTSSSSGAYNTLKAGADDYSNVLKPSATEISGTYTVKSTNLLENVTGFEVSVLDKAETTNSESGAFAQGVAGQIPRGISVTLRVMKKADFDVWKEMTSGTEKNNYAAQHEMVFTRTFALPEVSRDLSQL